MAKYDFKYNFKLKNSKCLTAEQIKGEVMYYQSQYDDPVPLGVAVDVDEEWLYINSNLLAEIRGDE